MLRILILMIIVTMIVIIVRKFINIWLFVFKSLMKYIILVVYVDAQVAEEKDNACRTIAQIANVTG